MLPIGSSELARVVVIPELAEDAEAPICDTTGKKTKDVPPRRSSFLVQTNQAKAGSRKHFVQLTTALRGSCGCSKLCWVGLGAVCRCGLCLPPSFATPLVLTLLQVFRGFRVLWNHMHSICTCRTCLQLPLMLGWSFATLLGRFCTIFFVSSQSGSKPSAYRLCVLVMCVIKLNGALLWDWSML